jgi:hypothetical protein
MKVLAELLEMGSEVDDRVDPVDGDVLVLFKMRVEDARQLGPLLYAGPVGLQLVLRKVPE